MFNGTTIDELMEMVDRAEINAQYEQKLAVPKMTLPAFTMYSLEQFKTSEREVAFLGVA